MSHFYMIVHFSWGTLCKALIDSPHVMYVTKVLLNTGLLRTLTLNKEIARVWIFKEVFIPFKYLSRGTPFKKYKHKSTCSFVRRSAPCKRPLKCETFHWINSDLPNFNLIFFQFLSKLSSAASWVSWRNVIEIINNKARHNLINVKYRQMAFRSARSALVGSFLGIP